MGAVLALKPEFKKFTLTVASDWELLAKKHVHSLYHNDSKAVDAWISLMIRFEVTPDELVKGDFRSRDSMGNDILATLYSRFKRPYSLNKAYSKEFCLEDSFSFIDKKYRTTLNILKHKKIKNITTSSDLIAHDEYVSLIPRNCKVKLVFKQNEGTPSFKRLQKAKEKLEAHGITVDLVCQK
jgi:hypothetical protein